MTQPDLDGVELMRQMIAVLQEHFLPLHATLLDGTISCSRCAALVLQESAKLHEEWHQSLNHALRQLAGGAA